MSDAPTVIEPQQAAIEWVNAAEQRMANETSVSISYERLASERGLPQDAVDALLNAKKDDFQKALKDLQHATKDSDLYSSGATISWKDVSFGVVDAKTGEMKTILEPCSGVVPPGTMIALMGPSGCGKSTLLDMLADKKTAEYSGEILFNGRPRCDHYKLMTAYVPQEDLMFPYLTVKETITFVLHCRFPKPKGVTRKQWEMEVDTCIQELGLEHVQHSKIGNAEVRGISGGQRRRVTLAKGIVSGAVVVFADEPTSGLSSTDTEIAIRLLKLVAKRYNVSFFIVIHQPKPEVAFLFDDLLLLTSQPGRVVYHGPMSEMVGYYASAGYPVPAHTNPADHCLDMVSPAYADNQVEHFVAKWREAGGGAARTAAAAAAVEPMLSAGELHAEMLAQVKKLLHVDVPTPSRMDAAVLRCCGGTYPTSLGAQFRLLWDREVKLCVRDPSRVLGFFLMSIVMGVFLGLTYFANGTREASTQLAFIVTVYQCAFMSTMLTLPMEDEPKLITKLEGSDQLYSLGLYISVRITMHFLYSSLSGFFAYLIPYAMAQLPWKFFGWFLFYGYLGRWALEALFLSLPSIGKNAADGQTKLILLVLLAFLFNGLGVNKANAPEWMWWGLYVSPSYWQAQAIVTVMFANNATPGGESIIQFYRFDTDQIGIAIGFLVGYHFLFRLIHIFAYTLLYKPQR